jgi:peptide-methionine (S)-S-oxide reductase
MILIYITRSNIVVSLPPMSRLELTKPQSTHTTATTAYRNHPGHYEVILIEYDPTKTSYEVLVNYAYRNMDPFDGLGQFCDKGTSYLPAIFYEAETEREVAEDVLASILEQQGWDLSDIAAPILERPVFWTGT